MSETLVPDRYKLSKYISHYFQRHGYVIHRSGENIKYYERVANKLLGDLAEMMVEDIKAEFKGLTDQDSLSKYNVYLVLCSEFESIYGDYVIADIDDEMVSPTRKVSL